MRRQLGRLFAAIASVITLLIAGLGAVTGTISFVRSGRIAIVVATTGPYSGVHQGVRDLGVSVVNTSSENVNLASGTVIFGGSPMGVLTGVLSPRQGLPYTIDAGGSFAGAVTWRITDAALARSMLSQWEVQAKDTVLRLRLDFIPGGAKYVNVTVAPRPPFAVTHLAPSFYTAASGWQAAFEMNTDRRVLGVLVITSPRPYVLTLRIWRALGSSVIETSEAPIVGTGALGPYSAPGVEAPIPGGLGDALLPVGRLGRGTYAFAVSNGPDVVITGGFAIPCPHVAPQLLEGVRKGARVATDACLGNGGEHEDVASNPLP